ncbi:hypothetical protein A2U01_0109454, partial [Trifolium medium]|nr:hypothetical protein [Trifolium medium]
LTNLFPSPKHHRRGLNLLLPPPSPPIPPSPSWSL